MTVDDPKAIVIVLLILYMTIKDVVGPLVKRITGQNGDDVSNTINSLAIAIKVLETKVDHLSDGFSEMRETIKASTRKRKN